MNYFKGLGIVFGLIAMLKPFYMHILPWDENKLIAKVYAKKRPKWVVYACLLITLLIGFTWYMHLTTDVSYSIIITVLFSLLGIKTFMLLFNYEVFHKFVAAMLNKKKGKGVVIIDSFVGIFGMVILILTFKFL